MNIARLFSSDTERFEYALSVKATHTLHSPKAVEDILRREQTRADRNGSSFCCVLARLDLSDAGARPFQRLFSVLDRRSRLTDEIGWFDSSAICVILPSTDEAGARCYASDILDLAREARVSPSITIYVYEMPSNPPERDLSGRGSRQRRRHDSHAHAGNGRVEQRSPAAMREVPVLGMEVLFFRPLPLGKRVLDIIGAGAALLLLSPLALLISALIKCAEPDCPVFFRQLRAGLGGRPFTMLKFRTMCMDADERKEDLRAMNEQDGPAFKIKADPRVTPIGRLLRKTSLDELPQLVNVLSGDMSLVGPRPPTFDEVGKYKRWHRLRLTVTPGITCVWQVEGRSSVTFEQWMRMDARYVRESSLWCDLKLLARTIPAVLFRRGAC